MYRHIHTNECVNIDLMKCIVVICIYKRESRVVKTNAIKRESDFQRQLRKNSYILREMVKKNFKAQYKNSLLGVLWTVLNPLLNMIVLSFVFSSMFADRLGGLNYPVYLFCGNLIFNIMNQITRNSLECLVWSSDLIKKVKISYSVFPISNMFTALVNFGVAFIALLVIMLIEGVAFHWTIFLTVLILPAVLFFSLGLGFILSSMYVFFRDVKHLYEVFVTLWMYLTPIFYPANQFGEGLAGTIINLNPMTNYVTMFRQVVQMGQVPGVEFAIGYAWGIGMLLIGYLIFRMNRKKYILYI